MERVTGAFSGIFALVTHHASSDGIIIEHIRIRHTRQIRLWLIEKVTGSFRAGIDAVTHNEKGDGSIFEHIRARHARYRWREGA
jgi:hypothetical protein